MDAVPDPVTDAKPDPVTNAGAHAADTGAHASAHAAPVQRWRQPPV